MSEIRERGEHLGLRGVTEELRVLLARELITSDNNGWRLTKEGLRKRRDMLSPPELPQRPLSPAPAAGATSMATAVAPNRRPDATSPVVPVAPATVEWGDSLSSRPTEATPAELRDADSPWAVFRRAVNYYIDCVRLDERPSTVMYAEQQNQRFMVPYLVGSWWPEGDSPGSPTLRIPTLPDHAPFLREALSADQNTGIYIGYPVHAVRFSSKGKKAKDTLLLPICCIPVLLERPESNRLSLAIDFDDADLNSEWLQKYLEKQQIQPFLRHARLLAKDDEAEDAVGLLSRQSLQAVVNALRTFVGNLIKGEGLNPTHTLPILDVSKLESGIHNCAVIYTDKRVKYSAGLLRELRQLKAVPDSALNRTSLRPLFLGFPPLREQGDPVSEQPPVAAPFLPLNDEQEAAVRAAVQGDLTVITGPPGTGKSQVAAALLANLTWQRQTAVFSSKNHKAIDAVVPRTNDLVDGDALIFRQADKESGTTFTWHQAVRILLNNVHAHSDGQELQHRSNRVSALTATREKVMERAERWSQIEVELGRVSHDCEDLEALLPAGVAAIAKQRSGDYHAVAEALQTLSPPDQAATAGLLGHLQRWRWILLKRKKLKAYLDEQRQLLAAIETAVRPMAPLPELLDDLRVCTERLTCCGDLAQLTHKIAALEDEARQREPLTELTAEFQRLNTAIADEAKPLLKAMLASRSSELSQDQRHRLMQIRGILANRNATEFSDDARMQWERFFEEEIAGLLRAFPMWAVTALSARHALPFGAGLVDVAIIDEASQCEIPALLPVLFRAKRAVIIGDPHQFRPVITLHSTRNRLLMERHGLTAREGVAYDYKQFSLFDAADNAPFEALSRVQLKDHFRCHSDIATYCNNTFYSGTLRVLTDEGKLKVPAGAKAGILWTDVEGEAVGAGRGATCQIEAERIRELVAELVSQDFQGSVGIISPFVKQAQRIGQLLSHRITEKQSKALGIVCSTAHAFQGGECDVIYLSPVFQPGLPKGARWAIGDAENRNLMNVAASRARAVLHVVGNRKACQESGIAHLQALAADIQPPRPPAGVDFQSPWERALYEALRQAGIDTVSQYPLVGRYLDLAIPSHKIDIEVDGVQFHWDASAGRRKADDLWRDVTVQAAGWRVVRFWVFELRENMSACVEKVTRLLKQ